MTVPATLLLCSHGTSSVDGQRAVAGLVAAVAAATAADVRAAFVDVEHPDVPTALAGIDGPVAVVPLLLSAGYHVYVDLTQATAGAGQSVLTDALGPDPRLAQVLADRLRQAGLQACDAVVLAAAGSSDARAVADCERTGQLLATELGVPVQVGYLSAATPRLPDAVAAARARSERVAVATYLLAPGYFHDLAAACGADAVADPLVTVADVPTALVDVVLDRACGIGAPSR